MIYDICSRVLAWSSARKPCMIFLNCKLDEWCVRVHNMTNIKYQTLSKPIERDL